MIPRGSVVSDERLRLFLALRLPEDALDRLAAWQAAHLARRGRVVDRGNLHVTLAFLGSRPRGELLAIADELLAAAAAATPPVLRAVRYGETRSVGMVVLDDDGGRATALAGDVQELSLIHI